MTRRKQTQLALSPQPALIGLGTLLGLSGLAFAAYSIWRLRQAEDGTEPMNDNTVNPTTSTLGYIAGKQVVVQLASIGDGKSLYAPAAANFNAMKAAARVDGVSLVVNTAFRDMAFQQRLYAKYLSGQGNLAAKPGYSTHQAGLSVDVSTMGKGKDSVVYKWLAANAGRYGFVNDVASEPWHWTWTQGKAMLLAGQG